MESAWKGFLMTARLRQRPEALAQFAETARTDKRKDRPGLVADEATAPIATDSKAKDEAATKILQEGATGEDHGTEAAVDRLPDRIFASRRAGAEVEQDEPESSMSGQEAYDATSDPRTGRPPSPIEADKLNRERELEQLRNAQRSEGEEDDEGSNLGDIDELDIDVTLEEDELTDSGVIDEQAPARMISPEDDYAEVDEDDSNTEPTRRR
jgi:hypothetical protein